MKRVFSAMGLCLPILVAVMLTRTMRLTRQPVPAGRAAIEAGFDKNRAAARLAAALQFQTVSYSDPAAFRAEEFLDLHAFIGSAFPRVGAELTMEVVGDCSLLYTWKGQEQGLKPILLMGHIDVVPVEPGTEKDWDQPPFAGRIADGYVWGRGALDDKASVMGILEAVEWLLGQGFKPSRTVYLAFGHDEEIGGHKGAAEVASLLRSRGVGFEYVLDEGQAITEGIVPGVSMPVAFVGIAEKGYADIELTVESEGGHSSMPPPHTAIGVLSAAIEKLERKQMPAKLTPPVPEMFEHLAPEMPFLVRMAIANRWLLERMILRQLAASPITNTTIRTTTAATMFNAGVKENVLPTTARAVVNFRILPGDSVSGVVEHVRATIDDPQISVRVLEDSSEPPPLSDALSHSYQLLEHTIHQVFPDMMIAPALVVGATDSRYMAVLSSNVYRFVPIWARPEDLARVHGTGERISVRNYEQIVRFYIQLIRNSVG